MIYYDFLAFKHSPVLDSQSGSCRKVIVFLGNALDFPNHNLEVIAAELPGVDILRLEKLAEASEISDRDRIKVILLIVAQDRFEDLTDRYTRYSDAAPDARIVFAYESQEFAKRVYQTTIGQVVSYLPMRCRIDVWTAYLQLLCNGELVVPCALASRSKVTGSERTEANDNNPSVHLTPRENEVLAQVAGGAGNREIAKNIGISEHTVKLHLHNVFSKLGVSNRAGAVAWYIRNAA